MTEALFEKEEGDGAPKGASP